MFVGGFVICGIAAGFGDVNSVALRDSLLCLLFWVFVCVCLLGCCW